MDEVQYVVTMRCTVIKQICCENCTEEQARREPFEHAIDEEEVDQIDWLVTDVEKVEI